MTAHQDVAGLVARLQERTSRIGPSPDQMINFMDGVKPLITEAADRLESLSQALREAEAERYKLIADLADMKWRSLRAESRLAEAMKVIEPFASRNMSDINDCVDNHGMRYQSQWFADATASARAFIAGNGGKDT